MGYDADDVVSRMSSLRQDALLDGAAEAAVMSSDGQLLEEAILESMGLSETILCSQWWAGSQLALGTSEPNNATWLLNAPNGLGGLRTEVGATIVHGGFLNQNPSASGWDHLAILTRGATRTVRSVC